MERYSRVRLMKKIVFYISVVLMLGSLMTVLVFNKNSENNINDSVVYVESIDSETIKSGSGFVYKINGDNTYIITSYHVIEGFNNIYVYNNAKEKVKVDIIGFDEYTDVAVLSINNGLGLKQISIGNSNKVSNSDDIFVVGTPIDIENINTKVSGVISKNKKEITINTTHGTSNLGVLEVNAKIDYGNSGGPLLNSNYEVIGMVFVKDETSSNKGYALPINFVIDIANKLINNELKRPNLGAVMCNTTNLDLLNQYGIRIDNINGVVILEVKEQGLLYNLGLQKGDIITKFDGKVVNDVNQFREALYKKETGDKVQIEYYQDRVYQEVDIQL